MDDSRIQDLASLKKLEQDVRGIELMRRIFPWAKPLLRLLRVDVRKIAAALYDPKVDAMIRQAKEFVTIPDRFNRLFLPRGWLIYEMLNLDVARAALQQAEAGDLDGAERLLSDHYDEESLRYHLMWMSQVKAFRPRRPLAEKAQTDYLEGRYHACVPVVLAILDGTVNDLGPKSFFSQG